MTTPRHHVGRRGAACGGDAESAHLVRLAAGRDGRATERAAKAVLARDPAHPVARKALSAGLIRQARFEEAVSVLDAAIDATPGDWELHHNLSIALSALRRFGELASRLEQAITGFPDHHEYWKCLGVCYVAQHRWADAIAALLKAIDLSPNDDFEAISQVGYCLFNSNRYEEALVCLKESLHGKQLVEQTLACVLHSRLRVFDWDGFGRDLDQLRRLTKDFAKPSAGPFFLLCFPGLSAEEYVGTTRAFAEKNCVIGQAFDVPDRQPGERLRIGYMSADFREHPVGYLISEVLRCHDRSRFEVFGYALHPADGSELSKRIRDHFDEFRDVSTLDDREIATMIRSDRVDVLVDLTGWTSNGRSGLLRLRPAPVSVNWLGYPGTLGLPGLADYILADAVVIPEGHERLYTERVWRLPGCYLPYDAGKAVPTPAERSRLGLPQASFVFCSFNTAYKLNPPVFDAWCRILVEVADSVLWLPDYGEKSNERLRAEARQRHVAPDQIVFAPRLGSRDEHLARIAAADLALDPFPYNSHSTGMDALWSGLPMVALLGDYFPGRVGASALTACGLADLVATDVDGYVRIAVELARNPARLKSIRESLSNSEQRHALFDMAGYTRRIEAAFDGMARSRGSAADGDH